MASQYSLFSFGSINKRLMYPILTGVSHVLIRIGNYIMQKEKVKNTQIMAHPVLLNCAMFFGASLEIFPFIIEFLLSKSKKNKPKQKKKKNNYLKVCSLIFLIVFLEYFASFSLKLVRTEKNIGFLELIAKLLTLGLTAIISIFMLNMKYYIHHVIGFIILLLGLFGYGLIESAQYIKSINTIKTQYFVFLLIYLIISLEGNIEKYLLDYEYVSSHLIVALEGLFGLILSVFATFILNEECKDSYYICKGVEYSYWNGFKEFFCTSGMTLGLCLYILGVFLFNTFKMKTNQSYTPTHRSIGDNLSGILFWIMQLTIKYFRPDQMSVFKSILQGLAYLVITIGLLIFLELIIVHFCNIDVNTRDNINYRIEKEKVEINNYQELGCDILNNSIENQIFEEEGD